MADPSASARICARSSAPDSARNPTPTGSSGGHGTARERKSKATAPLALAFLLRYQWPLVVLSIDGHRPGPAAAYEVLFANEAFSKCVEPNKSGMLHTLANMALLPGNEDGDGGYSYGGYVCECGCEYGCEYESGGEGQDAGLHGPVVAVVTVAAASRQNEMARFVGSGDAAPGEQRRCMQRRRLTAGLHHSGRLSVQTGETLPVGLLPVELPQADQAGAVFYSNPAARRMCRMASDGRVDAAWRARMHAEDRTRVAAAFVHAVASRSDLGRHLRVGNGVGERGWGSCFQGSRWVALSDCPASYAC